MLDVLFSKTRKRILELFFTNPDGEYHLREVVRCIGGGRGAIARELKTLSEAGILAIERKANLVLYKANRECPVYTEIHGLVIKTSGIADVVKSALLSLDGVSIAFIFGSTSRGDMDRLSDIDVFIVGTAAFSEISRVLSSTEKILGRSVSPVAYTIDDFCRKVSEKNRFVMSVLKSPIIMLIGSEDELRALGSEQS